MMVPPGTSSMPWTVSTPSWAISSTTRSLCTTWPSRCPSRSPSWANFFTLRSAMRTPAQNPYFSARLIFMPPEMVSNAARRRGRRGAPIDLVGIGHDGDQAEVRRGARVAGDQLAGVVRQVEEERIAWVGVDDAQVGALHGELAEAQLATLEEHVVLAGLPSLRFAGLIAETEHDVIAFQPHRRQPALDAGRRQHAAG